MNQLLLFICLLFFSSCLNYQYITVSGIDIKKNEQNEFVHENDSIKLVYRFSGVNGPVNLTVYNKLEEPLYIDWQRSALVINEKTFSYVDSIIPIRGSIEMATEKDFTDIDVTRGEFKGAVSMPSNMYFLPPGTHINKTSRYLQQDFREGVMDSISNNDQLPLVNGTNKRVKHLSYTEAYSPVVFRSYLTFVPGHKTDKVFSYQHHFYISDLYQTNTEPAQLLYINNKRGDFFYVTKLSGAGTALGVIALFGVLVGAGAAAANYGGDGNQ